MSATIGRAPASRTRAASLAARRACSQRSSAEKPRPADTVRRSSSPSKIRAERPWARTESATSKATVDFPAQGRPVSHTTVGTKSVFSSRRVDCNPCLGIDYGSEPQGSISSPPPATDPRRCTEYYPRSEEHTSELQSRQYLVCRLLLEKKKNKK